MVERKYFLCVFSRNKLKKIYSGSIEKKEVELLIKTLDLKEKNLQKKLIVQETGEIYLQGIYYSGDTTDFREAFYKFLQEETGDNEKQQKKLLKCYADIVWE